MASRYGNQDYERRGRGTYGRSEYEPRYDREHSRFGGGSRFEGRSFRGDDQEENYFGGRRPGYGEGNVSESRYRDSEMYPRDYETGYTGPRFGDRDESDYNRGYGENWRRNMGGGYSGQTGYGSTYGRGESGPNYPESERGFRTGYEGRDRGWWDRASDEVSSWFGDEEAERRRQMDERRAGNFRGKGPKNYTRSDERIREDVNDRLTDYAYIDASDIEVTANNGEVVLSGTVDSRYDKRLAESIAEDVSGVRNVENRIRVNRDYSTGDWSYSDTAGHTETSSGTTGKSRGKAAGR